ncbi:MAG TPA: TolC family protein, partial [Brevundimonas sp.]|nr:TolC family protein [Brevundimonas sp.]
MTVRSTLRLLTTTAGAALFLASCAVGPQAPDAALPPSGAGPFIGSASPAVTAEAARDDWWRLYEDPILDTLIGQALAENNELEAASANLRRVRAALGEARTGRLPSTTTTAAGQYGRASAATVPGGNGGQALEEGETYDIGLDVAYEIDLFG